MIDVEHVTKRYGDRLAVDDIAGVGFGDHRVQRGTGLVLIVQYRPVDRCPAAIFGQQRAVHVVGAARGQRQQLAAEHRSVIEGEQEFGPRLTQEVDDFRSVWTLGRQHLDAVPERVARDAVEPDVLAGCIDVREHDRHLDAVRQQCPQAAHADIMIGEYHRPRAHGCPPWFTAGPRHAPTRCRRYSAAGAAPRRRSGRRTRPADRRRTAPRRAGRMRSQTG